MNEIPSSHQPPTSDATPARDTGVSTTDSLPLPEESQRNLTAGSTYPEPQVWTGPRATEKAQAFLNEPVCVIESHLLRPPIDLFQILIGYSSALRGLFTNMAAA